MAKETSIRISLKGTTEFRAGMKGIDGEFNKLGNRVDSVGIRLAAMGTKLTSVGKSLTLFLTAPILLAGGALVKLSAEAAESENLFEVSMGNMADAARDFSEVLRDNLGLNAFEVRKQVATFNQMSTAMGVAEGAAFDMSKGLVLLTNDMASFFNLRTEDAFLKISAAISGEVEPLKRLGIVINETTIKQTGLRLGLIKQKETLSEAQKVQLRYITILEQTKNAQGDLARTIDSPTNRMRIFKARLTETAITIGNSLLPAMNSLLALSLAIVKPVEGMINRFQQLDSTTKGVVLASIGLVVAIGPMISLFGVLVSLSVKIGAAMKFIAITMVPVAVQASAITVAVITLIAAFQSATSVAGGFSRTIANTFIGIGAEGVAAFKNIQIVMNDVFISMAEGLAELTETSMPALSASFDLAASKMKLSNFKLASEAGVAALVAEESWKKAASNVGDAGEEFMVSLGGVVTNIVDNTKNLIGAMTPAVGQFFDDIGDSASMSTEEFKQMYDDLAASALEGFRNTESLVSDSAAKAAAKAGKAATEAQERANKEREDLANKEFRFLVDTGQKTLAAFIQRKNEELGIHIAIINSKAEATLKERDIELALRREILDLNTEAADATIERITGITDVTEEEAQKQLEIELAKYEAMGEAGFAAAEKIREAMKDLADDSTDANDRIITDLTDISFRGVAVAQKMHGAFQNFFVNMVKGAGTTKDKIKAFFIELADAILAEFARIAASAVFKWLTGGMGGGGGGGGGLFGGKGGFLSAALTIGSLIAAIPTGGLSVAATAGGMGFLAGGAATIGSSIGVSAGALGAAASGASAFGFATGGEMMVQRPTAFVAGEFGPEKVSVRPAGTGARMSSGAPVVFSGINIIDPISMVDFERRIENSIARGSKDIL